MVNAQEIYNYIDEIASFNTAMEFDNVGLLVGNFESKISKILLSLDITNMVCEEAKKLNAELIISHHPVIFHPLKSISSDSAIHNLIKSNINAICAHTNLDLAEHGVNYCLAKKLELKNLTSLAIQENGLSLGLVGELSEYTDMRLFAKNVKTRLGCEGVRYTNPDKKIRKVAVCGGSGGDLIFTSKNKGADVFVTGEIKHNQILEANEIGLAILDAGHFKTENVVIPYLEKILKEKFPTLQIFKSEIFDDGIKYL